MGLIFYGYHFEGALPTIFPIIWCFFCSKGAASEAKDLGLLGVGFLLHRCFFKGKITLPKTFRDAKRDDLCKRRLPKMVSPPCLHVLCYWVVATQIFLECSSLFGTDSQFDDHIFRGVGSTTN